LLQASQGKLGTLSLLKVEEISRKRIRKSHIEKGLQLIPCLFKGGLTGLKDGIIPSSGGATCFLNSEGISSFSCVRHRIPVDTQTENG